MKAILHGTVVYWCIVSILAQWDCISVLNPDEYYGFTNYYCDSYECGIPCAEPFDYNGQTSLCALRDDGELLPTCSDEFGDYEKCDVEPCNVHAGCYESSTNGSNYDGLASYTENGFLCTEWSDVIFESWDASMYPETDFESNHCRNPNGQEKPWCFYTDYNGITDWSYCSIPACKTTVLSEFSRLPNLYNSEVPNGPGIQWESTYFDEYTLDMEEQCALLCIREASFVCRQFHVSIGMRYCEWLEYGQYHMGSQVDFRYDTMGDVFLRRDEHCYGFYSDTSVSDCSQPLGIESGWIPDANIEASSYLDDDHAPHHARLYGNSSWIPLLLDRNPVLRVTFPGRTIVTGLLIQGGGEELEGFYVSSFHIAFTVEGYDRVAYYQQSLSSGLLHTFTGNYESTCVVQVMFDSPIWTHQIMVLPSARANIIALRIEFLGCRDDGCGRSLNEGYTTASSFLDFDHYSSNARLNPFRRGGTGWAPDMFFDNNPWIQVTFQFAQNIAAIMTRKCGEESSRVGWLVRFDLLWALPGFDDFSDGQNTTMQDLFLDYGEGSLARIDFDSMITDTRAVRIYPTDWGGDYECLTADLIGCETNEYTNQVDDAEHDKLIFNVTCEGCNTNTLSDWALHQYAADGSSGIEFTTGRDKWIQIEFSKPFIVTGLDTQGGTGMNLSLAADLTSSINDYTISYQSQREPEDSDSWRNYLSFDGAVQIFYGLLEPYSVTSNTLERPFMAVRLRIIPRHSETIDQGRVRFRIRGSELTDITQICGAHGILYEGYCLGVIALERDNACHDVFQEGSYPLAIKSEEIQNFLLENRERLSLASALVIGLRSDVNGTYSWLDGTPVLYNNFGPNSMTAVGMEQCAFINFFNCFEWELYDCVPSFRSTVCQADLNECLVPDHGCAQTCVNHDGGFHCTCKDTYRIQDEFGCEDVCRNPLEEDHEAWRSIGPGACLIPTILVGTNAMAEEECELRYGRLPSVDEVRNLTRFLNVTRMLWVSPSNITTLGASPRCQAADVSPTDNVTALMWNCGDILQYFCVRDITTTKIQDHFDNGVENLELNGTYGYIEFRGFAPWFYTGRRMTIRISGSGEQQMRLDITSVNLRTFSGSDGCMDRLYINMANMQNLRVICGQLPGFRLVVPSPVELEIDIGDLEASMEPLGFSLYYEAVDCARVRCATGCGDSSLVYQDGVLQTSPFPSMFSPFSECQVRVDGPPDKYIAIRFTDYRINTGIEEAAAIDSQCDDRLRFESPDLARPIERSCMPFPPLLITSAHEMNVRLSFGLEQVSEGFQANVTFFDKPGCYESSLDECMAPLYDCEGMSGIVVSPLYPMLATGVRNCLWHILTAPNSYVRLRFTELFFRAPCGEMGVDVFEEDIDGVATIQLGQFCRDDMPEGVVESNLNTMEVELFSVNEQEGLRMMIEYEAAYFQAPFSNKSHTDRPCPPSTSIKDGHWDYYNGSCYKFLKRNDTLTWVAAEDECASINSNGHLLNIRDRDEAEFVHFMMTSHWDMEDTDTYIGLGNRRYTGIFKWTDDSPMTYTDWFIPPFTSQNDATRGLNEPDGGLLDGCVQIVFESIRSTALWHDIPCLAPTARQFICEIPSLDTVNDMADIGQIFRSDLVFRSPDDVPQCPATMIKCGTGECIHNVYTCDGQPDCADGSDEMNCTDSLGCPPTSFTCLYNPSITECIPLSFYCDNVPHCMDGSDEFNCAPQYCAPDEFKCSNGRCIESALMCDLVDHCFDFSDEIDCSSKTGSIFTCYNGDTHPVAVMCDGIVDCIGSQSEDELDTCPYRQMNHRCDVDQIQCSNGACADNSSYCLYDIGPSNYITGCRDVSHLTSCEDFDCPTYSVKCPNSYCIPLRFRCNGIWDCPNGDDELSCESFVCPAGTYSCRGSPVCLPPGEVCDGIRHCPDADDEQFCGVICPSGCNCTGLTFLCGLPDSDEETTFIFSETAKKISITRAPLVLTSNNSGQETLVLGDQSPDHVTYTPFVPTDYAFLAELELKENSIETIPSTAFENNHDLYFLSLRGNQIQTIELGAFANLTKLRVLDIRDTQIPSNAEIRAALQEIPNLHTVYADSFSFCCMLNLLPATDSDTTGCFAPVDQFSSCDDLLKDNTLRVFMWILGISALAGNLCTIVIRMFPRKKVVSSTKVQSRLIINLAVADLMMGVYMLIIAIADQYYMGDYAINADLWRDSLVCRIAGLMSTFSSEVSVFIIMLISIDRVLCIVFAQHHHIQLSSKSSIVWLATVWVAAFLIATVPALPIDYFGQFYGRSSVCLGLPLSADRPPGWEYSLSVFLALNLVCFLITAVCYVSIFFTVHQSARNLAKSKDAGRHFKSGASIQVKLATRMAMIVGTDFICWMPIIIMGFLATSGAVEIPADVYAWTAVFILPLNSSLNPYLYTISTIWQHRKARQRQKAMKDTEGTQLSVSAAVSAATESATVPRALQEKYLHLTTKCILTPFNASTINMTIIPLSRYIEDRGQQPSSVDSSLIIRDIRKAVTYLTSKSVTGLTVTEDQIALQVNTSGEIVRALLVTTDASVLEMISVVKNDSRGNLHDDFMNKMMENIRHLLPPVTETPSTNGHSVSRDGQMIWYTG